MSDRDKLQQELIELIDQLRGLNLTEDEMEILSVHLSEDSSKISTVLFFLKFYKLPENKVAYIRRFIRLINTIAPAATEEKPVSKKVRVDNWVKYNAKDGTVDLPPMLVSMLDSGEFTPASREKFKQQLDNVQVGQQIELPSLGQEPKHYGEGYQGMSFLVTEQMMELWQELQKDSRHSIKRVLSGPMGVGKSYLALFLAAKAYADGWLLLYFSDASRLAWKDPIKIAEEICKRFLALNKDILTIADFGVMTFGHPTEEDEVVSRAAHFILGDLLNQLEKKTLLVVDEHGALFDQEPPIPKTQPLLNPLMQLTAWNEERRGTRVVLTGTAHAKFEREYLKNGMMHWLEFVTPLSDTIFDKLLDMSPILSNLEIRSQVKEITNNVPRELVNMAGFISETLSATTATTDQVSSLLKQFKKDRRREFFKIADKYFHKDLKPIQQHAQRYALAAMFLPRKEGDPGFNYQDFDYQFMDLGLVYRLKVRGSVQYRPLCQAAKGALLDIYKAMPLPRDAALAITSGNMTGLQFEDVLFQQLLRHPEVTLNATDLAGNQAVPVVIKFKHFRMLRDPPFKTRDNTLLRCYPGYPRFDYILGRMFIRTSISEFTIHNQNSANIEKAFEYPKPRPTRSFDPRNQIEKYLDGAFGGCDEHRDGNGCYKAIIDPESRRFIVTRDGKEDEDFRIVYIRGSSGFAEHPHTSKVKDFPDILHVSLEELQTKLFGDLLTEQEQ
ncbi:uncharacterized protein VTP21DRAFT_9544 [Calcarisporiella thermophila]|uniref:uncharacterized protein n=1 Tax=Calcarisporiella thermophila TaxID=911321 RepID=UPI0037427182